MKNFYSTLLLLAATAMPVSAQQTDELQLTLDSLNAYSVEHNQALIHIIENTLKHNIQKVEKDFDFSKADCYIYRKITEETNSFDKLQTKESGISIDVARLMLKYKRLYFIIKSENFKRTKDCIFEKLTANSSGSFTNSYTMADQETRDAVDRYISANKIAETYHNLYLNTLKATPEYLDKTDEQKQEMERNAVALADTECNALKYTLPKFYTKDDLLSMIKLDKAFRKAELINSIAAIDASLYMPLFSSLDEFKDGLKKIKNKEVDYYNHLTKISFSEPRQITTAEYAHFNYNISKSEADQSGKIYSDSDTDKPASFPGGLFEMKKYLMENFYLPEPVDSVNKVVLVNFTVEADGKISNITGPSITIKGYQRPLSYGQRKGYTGTNSMFDPTERALAQMDNDIRLSQINKEVTRVLLDRVKASTNEALRLVSNMPNWIPAVKNGLRVRSVCNITIDFNALQKKPVGTFTIKMKPSFPGGDTALQSFLRDNIHYPTEAAKNGIQGRVLVGFIVEEDGSLTNVKVLRSVSPLLDEEAIRVVKSMPRWVPDDKDGKPVREQWQVPVSFRLEEN